MKMQILLSVLLLKFATATILIAQMRIHLINVGQGCATLVEFPCGAILIDAGGETNAQIKSNELLKACPDDFFMVRSDINRTLNEVYNQ